MWSAGRHPELNWWERGEVISAPALGGFRPSGFRGCLQPPRRSSQALRSWMLASSQAQSGAGSCFSFLSSYLLCWYLPALTSTWGLQTQESQLPPWCLHFGFTESRTGLMKLCPPLLLLCGYPPDLLILYGCVHQGPSFCRVYSSCFLSVLSFPTYTSLCVL